MRTMLAVAVSLCVVAATPSFARTDGECAAAFSSADANKDGVLSEAEAPRYYAAHRISGKPVADGKLSRDEFMSACKADVYTTPAKVDDGAPLKGANSFTEGQAKDRALHWGYSDVSSLTKDADGIWRGTAVRDGKKVNIAVDFKGNVVAK